MTERRSRLLFLAVMSLLVLCDIALLGHLRAFFTDIWAVARAVIGPLLLSIIATYVLRPSVDLLEQRRVPRTVAILMLYAMIVVLILLLLINTIPLLLHQVQLFISYLPGYVTIVDKTIDHMSVASRVLPNSVRLGIEKALSSAEGGIAAWLSGTLIGVRDLISGVVSAFVIPFLVFYLLKDYSRFQNLLVRLFPRSQRETVVRILQGVDHALGRYVRGQLLVMALVGIATLIGLVIVRMPNALLLSVVVGLTNIIPYVGPFIGAAPGLVMALGISKGMFINVLLVNLIVQQLEGNLLSPMIMGKTIELHPLLILLGVMAAGDIGGITWLIFAVPILAVIKVVYTQIHLHVLRRDM